MERVFSIKHNQPLTVEAIQQILAKQISVTFSPDLNGNSKSDILNTQEAITSAELQAFAIGLGPETPAELTPLMLVLLADFVFKNPIANSLQIISRILEFYDYEVLPQVFSQGLYTSPAAHLILPVFGVGKVYYQGYLLKAADVHDIFSWQPIPWPEDLPLALTSTSFLGLSNLIYSFIQLKKLVSYSEVLLPPVDLLTDSGNLYPEQLEHLEHQLNSFLTFPEAQSKPVNGLMYQVVKLFFKFGEYILENLAQPRTNESFSIALNNQISTNSAHLLTLIKVLHQESFFLFEGDFDSHSGPSTAFTNQLMLQPFFFLKNLEKKMAITTLVQLTKAINPANTLNVTANLQATYRKQVIAVLKEADFDELIRKTIVFMYASVASK
ncbi:aromatic amino acid lyase [Adhaeribacter pallidiroseus]|uniref:Histidine ammonia-lyase n=1 Tax=Adhaeribacter pallidiroseus TaxID=2072847 RepID=A0A369QI75_9BACT|nr:aromatic amino acid lyase [Adhaeribacter pallidiroseus]RDC62987.1 Histidine ammonia-lyase [Adhaeribacter pallidiroseus]